MNNQTYLTEGNADYINNLYNKYKEGQTSVEAGWQKFFLGFDPGTSIKPDTVYPTYSDDNVQSSIDKEMKVLNLIDTYRRRGHLFAKTNPVRERRQHFPGLGIEEFGLNANDLDISFFSGREVGLPNDSLRSIIEMLEHTYTKSIGIEYKYIDGRKN